MNQARPNLIHQSCAGQRNGGQELRKLLVYKGVQLLKFRFDIVGRKLAISYFHRRCAVSVQKCKKHIHLGINSDYFRSKWLIRNGPYMCSIREVDRKSKAAAGENKLQHFSKNGACISRHFIADVFQGRLVHHKLRMKRVNHVGSTSEVCLLRKFFSVAQLRSNPEAGTNHGCNSSDGASPSCKVGTRQWRDIDKCAAEEPNVGPDNSTSKNELNKRNKCHKEIIT